MDNMIIERDVPIPSDDIILRADVFRPMDSKGAPVIMTMGPYGKGVEYKTGYAPQWDWLTRTYPDILPGSTRSFLTWETVDPEIWVPWGYVVIRVDSRGTGRSPGYLDILSPREEKDYYNAIEWAGTQAWSNGKVGLIGISYYAITQWKVAALQPPHLAAMIPWEGAADFYRDFALHGGIFSNTFLAVWYERQVLRVQHGNGSAPKDPWLNASSSGADTPSTTLTPEQLKANRHDIAEAILAHPLDDTLHQSRSPDWSKVTVPFLSAANWGGFGLHGRGNFEGFTQAASKHKWLECHTGRHEEWFYQDHAIGMQKRFMDCFLKEEENGWLREPSVHLRLRRPFDEVGFEIRKEEEWPLPGTKWTEMFLDAGNHEKTLSLTPFHKESSATFDALGQPLTFTSAALDQETELTGPLAATLFISSTTHDADLFVTLQAFSPEGKEVDFQGAMDPRTPLAQGWLRASHRELHPEKTLPYRPYHSHQRIQHLTPGEVYEVEVEIWPTHIILPKGYRLALVIGGRDFEREVDEEGKVPWVARGSGPFLHTNEVDRPRNVFGGRTTVYAGGERGSRVLLPIVPERR